MYDVDAKTELAKASEMVDAYNSLLMAKDTSHPGTVKWSESLKRHFKQGKKGAFDENLLVRAHWRPFTSAFLYADRMFNDRLTENHFGAFGPELDQSNEVMMICGHPQVPFTVHAIDGVPDAGYASRATQMFPRYVYAADATRMDNITDWSLAEFKKHYQPGRSKRPQPVTKQAIFHYVYAVLHDPQYRETYAQNLKREFPRIPLHGDSETTFWRWAAWGETLMALHIGYERVAPFALVRTDVPDEKARAAGQSPKCILKSDIATGRIVIDSETTLTGVPREAWSYLLGNRCAIDWVLDQYKEKKPKDPTIREKFDT